MWRTTCVALTLLILTAGCGKKEDRPAGAGAAQREQNAQATDGFDSPEQAFAALRAAAADQDIKRVFQATTTESQELMAASLVLALSLAAAFDPDSEQDIRQLLEKHGIKIDESESETDEASAPDPMQSMRAVVQPIQDKGAFIADAFAWMDKQAQGERGPDQGLARLAQGQLVELQVDGDMATAQVTTKAEPDVEPMPIEFRKQQGRWLVHLPELSGSGSAARGGTFPSDDMKGFSGGEFGDSFSEDWPDAPELMATIVGRWQLADGGVIVLTDKKTRDELGFEKLTGTYTPASGQPVPFVWESLSNGLGQLEDGGKRYFEATLMISADAELPFVADESATILIDVGNLKKATLQCYSSGSLETVDFPITKQ